MNQAQINYKNLRKINPETARTAVLEYLKSNGVIAETARVFGVQRTTIYNIINRKLHGNRKSRGSLKDMSRAPKRVANKTNPDTIKKILKIVSRTGFGAKGVQKHLSKRYKIEVAYGTLRGILRRNQG